MRLPALSRSRPVPNPSTLPAKLPMSVHCEKLTMTVLYRPRSKPVAQRLGPAYPKYSAPSPIRTIQHGNATNHRKTCFIKNARKLMCILLTILIFTFSSRSSSIISLARLKFLVFFNNSRASYVSHDPDPCESAFKGAANYPKAISRLAGLTDRWRLSAQSTSLRPASSSKTFSPVFA